MRFWRKSLLARLLASFLGLAIVSVMVVGAISYQQGRTALQDNIFNHLTTTASLKGDEIDRWVDGVTTDVELIVQNSMVELHARTLVELDAPGMESLPSYETLQDYLQGVIRVKPDMLEIMILKGTGGKVLLSTTPAHEGLYEVTSTFFTEGRRATFVQNPYPSASLGGPAMTVATPLRDLNGQTVAVLAAHLNLERLDKIMQARSGLGTTGETYLVDQYSSFISAARGGGESFPRGVHTFGIDTALLQQRSGTGIYENYRGVPVLGAYRWLENRDLALLAELEVTEALAPTRALARSVLIFGIMVVVLVVVVAYTLARQISSPIQALTETSARIARGELNLAVQVSSEDEIGTLAQTFNSMAGQVHSLIAGLEQRVAERTAELEQRAVQIATAAEVGRAATSILEPQRLAQQTVDLLCERFGLYYAGLFLIAEIPDLPGRFAVLEAGSGEAGRTMKERGHKLEVGGASMVGAACAERRAHIALDVGAEPVRFENPLLPNTHSEMALPLLVGERVLGALDVQSVEMAAFSEEEIAVMQLVANQVAVAIDNARRFSSEAALLEATSPLFRVSSRLAEAITGDEVVQAIVDSIAETEADGCVLARFGLGLSDEVETISFLANWRRVGKVEVPLGQPFPASSAMIPISLLGRFWIVEDLSQDTTMPESSREAMEQTGVRSLVNIPLRAGDRIIGFVVVERATPGPFTPVAVQLYETLAGQAAVALERARLLEEAQQRASRERAFRDVSERVFTSFDLQTVLQTTLTELGLLVGAGGGYAELGVGER